MEQLEPIQKKSVSVRDEVLESPSYDVVMHNDDETTMEFVVALLITVFFKSKAEATSLMMKIHNEGAAIVGTYNSIDIANSKASKAESLARTNDYPLRVTVEIHKNH
ncbi:MAG: ATP-dependent Clp protease adaptor ClpS [Bacteroidales bacterium]|nr:ATP-dependent Clp protease adaptor ClpS [Bacteroidales bacterium]